MGYTEEELQEAKARYLKAMAEKIEQEKQLARIEFKKRYPFTIV